MIERPMLPLAAVEPVIGRGFAVCADAQEAAEGVERIEAAVKAKRELVEVGLQVLRLDAAVMRALQPSFEIAENQVDDGQVFFGDLRIAALSHRKVLVAELAKVVVAAPCVRNHYRARRDGLLYKGQQRLSAARWRDFQAQPPGIASAAPCGLVAFLGWSRADLDGGDHKRLFVGVNALALPACLAPDIGFVNLDVIAARQIAADGIAVRP